MRSDSNDDETVGETVRTTLAGKLQGLLAKRDHVRFLDALESQRNRDMVRSDAFLRALAGEGLCLFMTTREPRERSLLERYAALILDGVVQVPAEILERLANTLDLSPLRKAADDLHAQEATQPRLKGVSPNTLSSSVSPTESVVHVRRVVQIMQMILGDAISSNTMGVLRSVFRSQQERTFLRALSLRFPGLFALPNYPLDQIVDLDKILDEKIDGDTRRYGRHCRLDAVLVIPDEGDPVAAFELDSGFHDFPDAIRRDRMKNTLIGAIGLPFFRLRAEHPESMSVDEWYALLSDEVVPHLDPGSRIRCRQVAYRLIPV